ncbi:MSCRAMM family protein [Traorella massiliensis]|uniref:MSCRAMM family protein n=1 Tax=Traorella massiliensis TaxID=1903263 RepID=UPI0008F8E7BD|nr:SpaA isopeptide-forming pilin-related protein [Traorella massiliensis]
MDDRQKRSSLFRKMKNGLKSLMMASLAFGMALSNMAVPAKAASPNVTETYTSNWKANHLHLPNGSNGDGTYFWIDGELGWCIEPGKSAHIGANESVTFESLGYNDTIRKTITYIAYFGYHLQPSEDNYFLTQNLIWATLRPDLANRNYYFNSTYPTVASQQAWRNDVMAKVNAMETTPEFNVSTITLDVGESITLTDSNNVLSNFIVNGKSEGLNVSINGNQLTITATASANEESYINLKRNIRILQEGVPFAAKVTASDSQAVSSLNTLKSGDPAEKYINITVNKFGNLNIAKKDDKGNFVPNTSFRISYNADMSDPIGTYTTGNDGTVTINELLPQTVYVQEVSVPEHLILDNTIRSITIVPNETVYFSATNDWKQGKIQVVKKDDETGKVVKKAGTQFDILNTSNQVVATITTNSEGVAISDFLDYGTYTVREKTAPDGYTVNVSESNPIAVVVNNQTYTVDISNTRVKGSITLQKEFDDTESGMTGDAVLNGVTYELHAHENILNPADGSVLYSAGSLIPNTSKQTDADGKIIWTDLYLGSYDVHEVTSNGTVVVNTVDVQADVEYADQNTPNVSVSVTHKDKPNEQAYSLIKIGSNGSTGEVPTLEGAEFTAKLKSDVDRLGWDAAPTYDVSMTDSKGYLESQKLPYGVYIVRETKKPDEHEAVEDFIITITEDSDEPQPWIIMNDAPFEGMLKLVKKDAETGKTVLLPNTTFKIKNLDTNEYLTQFVWFPIPHTVDTWSTTDQGIVYLNDVIMYGNYQLEEITAPNGYVLNTEPVKFTVSEDGVYEVGEDGQTPVITVEMEDISVKGQITVYKEGEVFTGIHQNDDGSYSFIYEEMPQSDTQFNIIADADIMDPSNDGTVLYEKDEIVETITTGTNGYATSGTLPLGEYRIEETKVQNGMILNTEIQKVKLEYKDQTVEVVSEEISFKNDRQKVNIELTKKDDEGNLLSGAVYGLYTKTDLVLDGNVLLPADTLIEEAVTDENGRLTFKADLPISLDDEVHFYVKEIKQPSGYVLSDAVFDVDTKFKEQTITTVNNSFNDLNEITKVEVSKKDITNSEEIEDAHLTVFPKDDPGAVFDTWISGQDGKNEDGSIKPHLIKGLEVGVTYVLRETSSPYGYAIAQDVEFTVLPTGEVQTVEMFDDLVVGRLVWNKIGEIFTHTDTWQTEFGTVQSPVLEETNILGAEITIYAAEDITIGNHTYYRKGEAIQTLESDWDAVESRNLLVGSYYYVETKTPIGYIPDTERHYFEIEASQSTEVQLIESTLVNDLPSYELDFTKTFEEGYLEYPDAYKDVVFGIFTRDDTYDYMGNVAIEPDTLVATVGIDEEGHLVNVPRLPVGNYYLRELSTNSAYILDENEYDFSIDQSHEDNVLITINDGEAIMNELKWAYVHVNKIDSQTGEAILSKDFAFTLYSDAECTEEILTVAGNTKDGYAEFDLTYGTWYIKETSAPQGYRLSDEVVKVEYNDAGLFVNGELVEAGEEGYYSIAYLNTILPDDSVKTDDSTPLQSYLIAMLCSLFAFIFILLKHRKTSEVR